MEAREIKSPELSTQRSIFRLFTNVPAVDSLSYRTYLPSSRRISAWNRETNSSLKTISLSNWRPSRVIFLSNGMICRLKTRNTFGSREGDFVSSISYIQFDYQMKFINNLDKRFPRVAFIPYPIAFGNYACIFLTFLQCNV